MSWSPSELTGASYVPPRSPPSSSAETVRSFATGVTIPSILPLEYNLKSVRKLDQELILIVPSKKASISQVHCYLGLWFQYHDLDSRPNMIKKVYWGGRQLHELPKKRLYYDLTLWGFGAPYSYGIMVDILKGWEILANLEKKKKTKAARKLEEVRLMKEKRVEQYVKATRKGTYRTSSRVVEDSDRNYPWLNFINLVTELVTLSLLYLLLFDILVFAFDKSVFLVHMLKLGLYCIWPEFPL